MARVFVLMGHPDLASYNAFVADTIVAALEQAGHDVRRTDAASLTFDPILHEGYKVYQTLEPDLEQFRADLTWCEHWIIIYPLWWGSTPALLQGLFDRAVLPGHAFKADPDSPAVTPLLTGRTGHIVTTMDATVEYVESDYRNADVYQMSVALLRFCGIETGALIRLGSVNFVTEAERVQMATDAATQLVQEVTHG